MQPLGNGIFPRSLAAAYGTVTRLRNAAYTGIPALSHPAGRPVISIGAVHAGGVGKTPMALLSGSLLTHSGYAIAFLSRGYRRIERRPMIVGPREEARWEQVGDEPALLHANLPESWLGIGPSRSATARMLAGRLPARSVFILDDGFQHRSMRRDVDIVCLPADPFNDLLLPAGPLREPISAIRRAQIACIIGSVTEQATMEASRRRICAEFPQCRSFLLHQQAAGWFTMAGREVAPSEIGSGATVVCGIARPERFIDMVTDSGIVPGRTLILPDHHVFSPRDLGETRGVILTTEKDAHRLSSSGLVSGDGICYLRVLLSFADPGSEHDFVGVLQDRME